MPSRDADDVDEGGGGGYAEYVNRGGGVWMRSCSERLFEPLAHFPFPTYELVAKSKSSS